MKWVLIIGGLVALGGMGFKAVDMIGDAREAKVRLEIALRDGVAFEKAYKEITRLQRELQEIEDEILSEPASEIRPSDPVIRRYYVRLRDQRAKAE